jgi:hypothetical protein
VLALLYLKWGIKTNGFPPDSLRRYCVGSGVGGAGTPDGCGAAVGEGVGGGVGIGVPKKMIVGTTVGVGTVGPGASTEIRNPNTMLRTTSRLIIHKMISDQLCRRFERRPIDYFSSS